MRSFRIIALVLVIWGLLLAAWPAAAAPLAQGCEGLVNAGFEDGFSDRGAGEVSVANGWNPWWQDGPHQEDGYNRRPEFRPEDAQRFGNRRVHAGNFAQKYFSTYGTHNAGIWQQVQVTPGSRCTFSIWVQVWSSQGSDPDGIVEPGNYRVYVGIDPAGGTEWSAPSVVWSEPRIGYNTWMQLSVTAVATANRITVYTRGHPEFRNLHNDSYWDDACLTIVRPRPTDTPIPPATKTPTPTSTPANTPTPMASSTPKPAYICVRVHDDLNANGVQNPGEDLLGNATIRLMDDKGQLLETYTTNGRSEPYCFITHQEGSYYLQEKNPEGYLSVSPDNWGVYVVVGTTMHIHFWDTLAPTPTPSPTHTPTSTSTHTPIPSPAATPVPPTPTLVVVPPPPPESLLSLVGEALYGVSGIIVALLGLVLIFAPLYLRHRS